MGNSRASGVNETSAETSRLEPFPGVFKELTLFHNLSRKVRKDMNVLALIHRRGLLCCKPHDELLDAVVVYLGHSYTESVSTISSLSFQPVCMVNFYFFECG